MGWQVNPAGLAFFLRRMAEEYAPGLPQYVTENGLANGDRVSPDGRVADLDRIAYFEGHLEETSRLVTDGVPVRGYFAWSLLDNYEWAFGYSKRFGIIHVDYDSMTRTSKRSYLASQDALKAR